MGTDIYMYGETKKGFSWQFARGFEVHRNYPLFCALSNARGRGPVVISEPKGAPPDMSYEISQLVLSRKMAAGEGFNVGFCLPYLCMSWLMLQELLDYDWLGNGLAESQFCKEVLPEIKKLGVPNSVRIIFWLD